MSGSQKSGVEDKPLRSYSFYIKNNSKFKCSLFLRYFNFEIYKLYLLYEYKKLNNINMLTNVIAHATWKRTI